MLDDNSYRLVIKTTLNNTETLIEFDTINPPSISDSSQITSQPMVSGDIISDHMFRNPQTILISGSFSNMGNKPTVFYGSSNDRLTNIQETFTKIKNEGIFCTLTTMSRGKNSNTRFMTRKNMVLTSIRWTENQSSVSFDFTFTEVLLAKMTVANPLYDQTDNSLPTLTDAKSLNFTDTLLDTNEVVKYVIQILREVGLVEDNFLVTAINFANHYFVTSAKAMTVTVGTASGTMLAGMAVLHLLGVTLTAIPVWGWIALGMVAVIAGSIAGIRYLFKNLSVTKAEKKYGIKRFKTYKSEDKTNLECERFATYVGGIKNNLDTLNDVLTVYACGTNENQQCIIEIDGEYYNFVFTKNNTSGYYSLALNNLNDETLKSIPEMTGVKTLADCNTSTALLTTSSGFTVYVVNAKAQEAIDSGKTQDEIDVINKDLTNYYILISSIDMTKYCETLQNLIINQMTVTE